MNPGYSNCDTSALPLCYAISTRYTPVSKKRNTLNQRPSLLNVCAIALNKCYCWTLEQPCNILHALWIHNSGCVLTKTVFCYRTLYDIIGRNHGSPFIGHTIISNEENYSANELNNLYFPWDMIVITMWIAMSNSGKIKTPVIIIIFVLEQHRSNPNNS